MTTPPTPKTLPDRDDPRVKLIYELLADAEFLPPPGELWEVHAARHIVATLAARPPAVAAPEELSDQQIIDRCNAAGVMWIPPQEETDDWGDIPGNAGFPGGFDMCTMDEMRRLLRAQPPAGQQPIYSKSEVKRLATHMGWEPKGEQQDRGDTAPSTALCAVCGLGRHGAAHRPLLSGPNQGESLDHAFTVDAGAPSPAAPGNGEKS